MLQKQKENLVWVDCPFYIPGMVRIHTPADAHQVYHALMNAMSVVYRQGEMQGSEITHKQVVSMIREDLAQALAVPDPVTGKTPYSALMGGTIAEFARSDNTKTLAALQKQLLEASHLPRMLVPFICDQLGIDLYMIAAATRTVEPLTNDVEDVIKNRRSVVILYSRNHYELVGILGVRGHITTLFKPTHRFIRALRDQLDVD